MWSALTAPAAVGLAERPGLHLAGTTRRSRPPRPAGLGALQQSMDIRAIAFDANGTLIRIQTEDGDEQIFRSAAHFLTYQGIDLHRDQVRDLYFQIMKE